MKLKKLISSLICTSLVLSSFVVVSANNVIVNESPINETDASTSADTGWTTEESNLSDVEVTYQQSSNYVVTIPKTIALDSKKQATYSIKVTGDIDTNQRVYVSPVDVISDTEEVDFYMKDQNSRKDDVVATVTQNKLYWSSDEVSNGYEETDNSISAPDLTSGTWKGTFQVEIELQTSNNENEQLVAGLYDADGTMLVSWEDSGISNTCSNAASIIGNFPKTTKVIISDSVTSIDKRAFGDCTSLTNVIIPNSVISIGEQAFTGCSSLIDIEIPDSVTTIDISAFAYCTSLTNIVIPNSVENIGGSAFFHCTSLTNIILPNSLTNIGMGMFSGCESLTDIEIPDSVTTIEKEAFKYCTSLKNVIIPDSVISIENYAFAYCYALKDVVIPNSVAIIGNYAFSSVPHITYHGTAIGSPWEALSIN